MWWGKRIAFAASWVIAFTFVVPAFAEPTAAERETARELLREGQELRDKGELEPALEKLRQAHAVVQTPITALLLAQVHVRLGHLVQARELALSVARMPVGTRESEQAQGARKDAGDLAEQLRPRIATIRVSFPSLPPNRTPILEIDGAPIAESAALAPQKVDPGKHTIAAHVGRGAPTRTEVTLAEGEVKDVELVVEVVDEPAPLPPAQPSPVREEPPASRTSPLVYAGFGVAVVGAAVGSITGVMAISKSNTSECDGTRCTAKGIDDIDSGRTLALVSTISFGVALAGAAVGVYGLLFDSPKSTTSTAWSRLLLEGKF